MAEEALLKLNIRFCTVINSIVIPIGLWSMDDNAGATCYYIEVSSRIALKFLSQVPLTLRHLTLRFFGRIRRGALPKDFALWNIDWPLLDQILTSLADLEKVTIILGDPLWMGSTESTNDEYDRLWMSIAGALGHQ